MGFRSTLIFSSLCSCCTEPCFPDICPGLVSYDGLFIRFNVGVFGYERGDLDFILVCFLRLFDTIYHLHGFRSH